MTFEQGYVFAVLIVVLGLFVWGRFRYDIVALLALLAVVMGGIVPTVSAFQGFGHPAVITVAAVLVISRSLQNSGIIGVLVRWVEQIDYGPSVQVIIISTLVAVLSGFMNNVGALALLLPVVLQIARRSNRAPGELMMPLAFGSLLGGLTTMVGTPSNIIVASFRVKSAGIPFSMFDFTPVGLSVAITGILFIGFFGWRLIPVRASEKGGASSLSVADYLTEVIVPKNSGLSRMSIGRLLEDIGETEGRIVALIRGGSKYILPDVTQKLRINDHLLLEGNTDVIKNILHNTPLQLAGNRSFSIGEQEDNENSAIEVVVKPNSRLIGRSVAQAQIEKRHDIFLLALFRHGRTLQKTLRQIKIWAGDVLLLEGDAERFPEVLSIIGCLPLSERDIVLHREPTPIPLIIFLVSITFGMSGIISLPVAFTGGVIALVVFGQIPIRELYQGIEWPVIVLLGAMVTVGSAMEISGANDLLADNVVIVAKFLPTWGIVPLILVTAMVLSDIINNAATAILMSQLSIQIADRIDVSADPLLMAVAVGSSCAFLTPIGHQSNILVMGPGGYRFGDYWRLGLPLELLIICISVPMVLFIWPL